MTITRLKLHKLANLGNDKIIDDHIDEAAHLVETMREAGWPPGNCIVVLMLALATVYKNGIPADHMRTPETFSEEIRDALCSGIIEDLQNSAQKATKQ